MGDDDRVGGVLFPPPPYRENHLAATDHDCADSFIGTDVNRQDASGPRASCGDVVDTGWSVPFIDVPTVREISGPSIEEGSRSGGNGPNGRRGAHAAPRRRPTRSLIVGLVVMAIVAFGAIAYVLL